MSQATGSLFETKSDFAYRLVRDRILSGQFEPGAVMQQRDLAAELGISTTPLREALRRQIGRAAAMHGSRTNLVAEP